MRVSLFITCLVDQFHPEIGFGLVNLLRRLGVGCDVPSGQTCCGQPALNSGCPEEARVAARQWLRAFRGREIIVAPSGSCTAMIKNFVPGLFEPGSPEHRESVDLAARTYELSMFLVRRLGLTDVGAVFRHRVAYHDSCHLLRELHVHDEPRLLLKGVNGLELVELQQPEVCCGFGGTFSLKYPELSVAMGRGKLDDLEHSGAEYLVANDTGCLMHLRGLTGPRGLRIRALHLAEVLGGGAEA